MSATASVLFCRIRGAIAALPLGDVVETMRPLPIEPLAGVPSFVVGLAVVRGAPLPVLDVGALLLGGASPAWTRFVTVRTKRADVVLAVEDVLGVGSLADAALRDLPPLTKSSDADVVAAVGARDHELLFVLDSVRLIPDSVWDRMATVKQ